MTSYSTTLAPHRTKRRNGRPVMTYVVRWRTTDGKQPKKTFYAASDAKIWIAQQQGHAARPVSGSRRTVGQAVAGYRESRRVSASRESADRSWAKRIDTVLGSTPVVELTRGDVKRFVTALGDDGLAPQSIRAVLQLLRATLDREVDDEIIPANPADKVRTPRVARRSMTSPDVANRDEVLAVAEAISPRFRALVLLVAFTGARWGEAVGMERRDVGLAGRELVLGRQVIEEVDGLCTKRLGGKNEGSTGRVFPVTSLLADALTEHLELFAGDAADALLFTGQHGGIVSRATFRQRFWLPATEAAGLAGRKITMRSLRASAASMMLQAGISPAEVARLLGHSTLTMVNTVYGRAVPGVSAHTAAAWEAAVSGDGKHLHAV